MRNLLPARIPPTLFLLLLFSFSCSKTDNAPSQTGDRTWTVSGKTGMVGSLDPLPGVTVRCAGISTTSGPDGSYELRGIPEGTHAISAERSDCEQYSRSIEVKSDMRYYVFLTSGGTILWGFISNAIDGPIRAAKVAIHGLVGTTDAAGRYELFPVPHGEDTLTVSHPRYLENTMAVKSVGSDMQLDVVLKRDSIVEGRPTAYYVDEKQPATFMYLIRPGIVYFRGNSNTVKGNQCHIYVSIAFPPMLSDSRFSLVEGSLEMCTDSAYSFSTVRIFSVQSFWADYNLTFNRQPIIGNLLDARSIGGAASPRYWTILGTEGLIQLLKDLRTNGVLYGVVIQGGGITPTGFYSNRSSLNQPKTVFRVRY